MIGIQKRRKITNLQSESEREREREVFAKQRTRSEQVKYNENKTQATR